MKNKKLEKINCNANGKGINPSGNSFDGFIRTSGGRQGATAKGIRRAGFWRTALICVLFMLTVFAAVFGFAGLSGKRDLAANEDISSAYAATTTNANAANQAAWLAAINAKGTAANYAKVKLAGNWVAEVKDATSATKALHRTEFGTGNTNAYYKPSTSNYQYAGALRVPSGYYIELDLAGYTIDRNLINGLGEPMNQYGYVMLVQGYLRIIDSVGGGKITGGWSNDASDQTTHDGFGLCVSSGHVIMDGGSITGNRGILGGAVSVTGSGSTFEMNGGKITDNICFKGTGAHCNVAGVYVSTLFTMNGGEISNNRVEFDDTTANKTYGTGGVVVYGTFTMNGGKITGNIGRGTARGAGGFDYSTNTNATPKRINLYGGEITDNIGYASGGICHGISGTLMVHGNPVVKNNWVQDDESSPKIANDIDMYAGRVNNGVSKDLRKSVIQLDAALTDGAELYVVKYADNYVTATANMVWATITKNYGKFNNADDPSKFFKPSLPEYMEIDPDNARVTVSGISEVRWTNKLDILNWQNAVLESTATSVQTVKLNYDITATDRLATNGMFAVPEGISSDVNGKIYNNFYDGFFSTSDLKFNVPASKNVVLDLNGHTIDKGLTKETAVLNGFSIRVNGGVFELTDTSAAKNGKITGGYNVGNGGGAIHVIASSTFIMNGGILEGNTAQAGGGVYISSGTFYLNGGTIRNNTAELNADGVTWGCGGGVCTAETTAVTFEMTGGTITGNTAVRGGGIYGYATTTAKQATNKITITGGSITNNTATEEAGGIGFSLKNNYFGLGGDPVIERNTLNGKPNDIHLPSMAIANTDKIDNGLISIVKPFTGSHKYGVYRNINYTFTKDFKLNNPSANPANYFTAQREDCYVDVDSSGEARILSNHGADNWYSAVTLSKVLGVPYTVKLTENWNAVTNATADFGTSLHGDETIDASTSPSNPFWYGSMYVVATANITLDLNGYTIDRKLAGGAGGTLYGNVINVGAATLIIKDTSTSKNGKITGGWINIVTDYYEGGGISLRHASSKIFVEGGIITGNKATCVNSSDVPHGVGGVGIIVDGGQFTMTGGAITGNLGSFAGGVGMVALKAGTLSLGGSAKIYNNTVSTTSTNLGDGTPSDVYNPAATSGTTAAHMATTTTYKIDIISPFNSDAHIGIHRPDTNNYTLRDYNGNVFTNGYSTYNSADPSKYFFSSDSEYGEIRTYGAGMSKEGAFWVLDPAKNWADAVGANVNAMTGSPITVTLYKDWIADADEKLGSGTGFGARGNMLIDKSNIILDLNGHTINRGLSGVLGGRENGCVLYMNGTCRLVIQDSSTAKTGMITGGNTSTAGQAGGIHIGSATSYLTIMGGTITGNKGDLGGVATYTSSDFLTGNYFAMGGSALVTGNVDLLDKPLNINLRAKFVQQITFDRVDSKLTSTEKSGVYIEGSSDFTDGFSSYHTDGANVHFVADSPDRFVIDSDTGECALYTYDNYTNWYFAVTESVKLKQQRTVSLVSDWVADAAAMFGDPTDNTTLVNGGGLRIPASANVILDLAGFTLNRNLTTGAHNGMVIYVEASATFTLRDTSAAKTGTVTGGYNARISENNDLEGGGVCNRGKFYMEGGTIRGNRCMNVNTVYSVYSTGGVYTDSDSGYIFRMTGGTITDNYGTFTGGVNVYGSAKVYLGGSAKIYGNKLFNGTPSDVLNQGGNVANKINVYSKFENDARIAVAYVGNNYGNLNNNVFTSSFASLNGGKDPADVFEGSDPLKYVIGSRDIGSGIEGMVICVDNEQNWRQGVAASSATNPVTVTLTRDWIASDYTTFVKAFGTLTGAYSNGGLNVPAGKYVTLDLNGHKLDRALTEPRTMGYVINVIGNFTLVDNSTGKTGMVTGGNSTDTGGGIVATSTDATSAITLLGGKITGNLGIVGGVQLARTNSATIPFAMGGSALVTGNTNNRLQDSDVVANNAVQMIDVVSPLTEKGRGKTGFTRDGVGDFTTNFATVMPSESPTDYFKSADPMYVYEYDNGEGALYTNNNQLNWLYAVKASVTGGQKQITFKLLDNWLADAGEFGVDATVNAYEAASNGALRVPATANIILDLNGFTLDRGYRAAENLGYIIRVDSGAILTIRDTSEKGTGVMTGGFNSYADSNEAAQSSAIRIEGSAKLYIEGGTIKGNRATGPQSSAITTDNASTIVQMTGGTITENYGGPLAAHTGAGAFNLRYTLTLKLGGSARIFGNKHNFNEYDSDIHFNAAGLYIDIVAPFLRSAHIGVAPSAQVNNYASGSVGGIQFTQNYSAYHSADDEPGRYFFGSWYMWHDVVTKSTSLGNEGAFWCMENYTNWINAAAASSTGTSGKTVTFQLTSDWTAETSEKFVTSFHPSNTTYYKNGAIHLPAGKSVILDLNGFTIDRGLFDGDSVDNGYALNVLGVLEIIDSSDAKTGAIIGANNKSGGGGIVVDNGGVLTINGGMITENKGIDGAGVYVISGGKLTLGGAIEIYGNVNSGDSKTPSNVYVANKTALIYINSELKNRNIIGVNRPSNGTVTSDFQTYMTGNSPLEYFVSENDNFYGIEGGDGELFFLSPDNFTNWQYAVDQSVRSGGKTQAVRLTEDWTADGESSIGPSFGSGVGFLNGALYVPENASIELDLAGCKVDRNIGSARRYGLVIVVLGKLTITDSSEDGTGLITGGKISQNDTNFYSGGIHIGGKGTLEMLGGTVSGNWSTTTSNTASGVYVTGGGTFILKDASVINNQSTVAGVYVASGAMFNVSGKAVVEGNASGAGVAKDVVFANAKGTISVTETLTSGAHIGVYRAVNNYAAATFGGSKITTNYSRYNSEPAETYFFASDAPFHGVIDMTSGGATEAALFCYDNATNWKNAVIRSNTDKIVMTVVLYDDWTATRDNETTKFGTDTTAFYNGALRVPASAQIVLDLNDNLLNRDMPRANDNGYVIYVEGNLSVIDSSTGGSGMIAGGWTTGTSITDTKYASGIHVISGAKLSLEGGAVSENNGVGVYLAGNNTFSLGGKTRVTGNKFSNGNVTNLYMHTETQIINVISEFASSAQFGVMRGKGASQFGSGTLTKNYSKYNKTVEPTNYFTSDDTRYMVVDEGYLDDETMEAAFLGKDNLTNWAHAVKTSLANGGRAQVCTLFEDWTADETSKSFGAVSGVDCFYNGSLYVPAKCHVILDLNGYTIDRALITARDYGSVIFVRGTLEIRDSSKEQTGTITGGYANGSGNNHSGRAGGIAVYTGTLSIEGGTITGNRTTSYAGGVYLSGGSTFTMLGGKITANSGRVYGGLFINDNATARFGGTAYVYGNKQMDATNTVTEQESNVYVQSSTNKLFISDNFKEGARIGVSVNVNHVPAAGRLITKDWNLLNNDSEVTKVFATDFPSNYSLGDYNQDGVHEAMLTLRNNKLNWSNTVAASIALGKEQTFVLFDDWTAEASGSNTSFGSGTGYSYGELFIPTNAKIIFDLNGHTIDRGFSDKISGVSSGAIFHVEGELTIIDSTQHLDRNGNIVQGKITGGYRETYGGAIVACKGTTTILAGLIEGNHSSGSGAISITEGKLRLGGTVQFADNIMTNGRKEDIHFCSSSSPKIEIVSELIAGADATKNDIYVRRGVIGDFTKNWGKYNPMAKPESRFKASLSTYKVSATGTGAQREAVMLSNNNNDNWIFAVNASLSSNAPQYFSLVDNWTAAAYSGSSYTTRFGTNSTAYRSGALLVPAGANIVFDLAGFTIDRSHGLANDLKYAANNTVIIVEGTLQIVDTSTMQTGVLKGGSYGVLVNNSTASLTVGGLIKPDDMVLIGDEANFYGKYGAGTITGNSIYGINVNAGSLTVTGGKITGNTNADVFVGKNTAASVNIGENAYVYTENRTAGTGLRLENSLGIINIVSKLTDDARIGFSRQGVGQLTEGWGAKNGNDADPYAKIFISEEPEVYHHGTAVYNEFKELAVSSYDNEVNWQFSVDKSLATGEVQEHTLYACWIAAENEAYTTSFGSTSAFRNGALYVPEGAKIRLNLNGHKLDRNLKTSVQNGIAIYADGELEIVDDKKENPSGLTTTCCDRAGGVITGGANLTASSGGALYVGVNGNVTITSGTIRNNKSEAQSQGAGAIYTAGKLFVNGGTIISNNGKYAGAVYVSSSGTFVMTGGTISDNRAAAGGGAIYTTGTFDFSGGAISDNTSLIGALYVTNGGKVTMSGEAAIIANTGTSAGGVYVNSGSNTFFKMNGGMIADNIAAGAGAIYAAGKVDITDGTISGNIATGTEINEGGGAMYITSSGVVTVTGGEITANNGENGIRIHGSGTMAVGGSAQIYNNVAKNKTDIGAEVEVEPNDYCDIFFTIATRKIDVVSEFTDEARIGIYRLGAGVFTSGYGMYNDAHPNTVFVSNRSIYAVSKTASDDVTSIEASIGTPVDPEPSALETPRIYNGQWQSIIENIDVSKITIGAIDENLLRISEEKDGLVNVEAVNAGSYAVRLSLADGYCWKDGSTGDKVIYTTVSAKQVALTWSHEIHYNETYDEDGTLISKEPILDALNNPVCIYDGKTSHKPNVAVAEGYLVTNVLTGVMDECSVTVMGANVNASDGDGHTATATALSNGNYKLGTGDEVTYKFVVEKADRPAFEITSKETHYNYPTKMEVAGNIEDGTLSYEVDDAYKSIASFNEKGELTVTQFDPNSPGSVVVKIKIKAGETKNYNESVATADITVVQGELNAKISPEEVVYGSTIQLELDGEFNPAHIKKVTYTLSLDGDGNASLSQAGKFTALGVGKVTVTAFVEANDGYYLDTTISSTIAITQKVLGVNWGDKLTTKYTGSGQTLVAPELTGLDSSDICTVSVYKAGFLGWDSKKETPTWTEVGTYDVGLVLSSPNYKLADESDYFAMFEISKATLDDFKFTSYTAAFGLPFKPEVTGYPEGASITISLKSNTIQNSFDYDRKTGEYTPKKSGGTMTFEATFAGDRHYEAKTILGIISIVEAEMPLEITPTEIYYGDSPQEIKVFYKDPTQNNNAVPVTEDTTITLDATKYGDFAELVEIDGKLCINPKKAGTIKLHLEHAAEGFYKDTSVDCEIVIKPREVTVDWTFDASGYVYNGLSQYPTATITGTLVGSDTCAVTGYEAYQLIDGELVKVEGGAKNAGDYKIKAIFDNPNYVIDESSVVDLTIDPLPVDLSWSSTTLTYNGESQAPVAGVRNIITVGGVTDKCEVTVIGTKNAGTGLTATAKELSNPNYTLTGGVNITTTFTINPYSVKVTWGDTELTYTGVPQAPTATAVGLLGDDTTEVTVSGAQTNVNPADKPYTATAAALTNKNYQLDPSVYHTTQFTIKAATPTITLKQTSAVYGTPFVLEIEGNDGNGTVTFTLGAGGGTTATLGSGNLLTPIDVGMIEIIVTVDATQNYEGVSNQSFTLTIAPRPIEVNWDDLEFDYDGNLHNPTATVTNAVFGDSLTLKLSDGKQNAGTYTASVKEILLLGESTNKYTIEGGTDVNKEFVINKHLLTITWSDTEFTYDGNPHAPTATLDGLIGSDTCTATVSSAVDAKMNIVASITELSNSNYTVEGAANETVRFNILQRLAKLEWSDTTLQYTGQDRLPTVKITNLVEGDTCEVTLSGAAIEVGKHTAYATSLSNLNYTLVFDDSETDPEKRTQIECEYEIVKATLEVNLTSSEVFFGDELTLTVDNNPTGNEPTFSIVAGGTGAATISGSTLKATKAGTVKVSVHIAGTDNYEEVSGLELEVTVKKLPVVIEWVDGDFTYDGTEQAPTARVTNEVTGYACNVTAIAGKTDAGENLEAKVTAIDNDNYTLEGGTNISTYFVIQKRPVTMITWDNERAFKYNGKSQGPKATASGIIAPDVCDVIVSGWQTNVGTGYTAEITGLSNSNYSLVGIIDLTVEFSIEIVKPTITLKTTEVLIGASEKIEIEGNIGNGDVTYTITAGNDYATISGDTIYGNMLGTVTVHVEVAATPNTEYADIYGDIQIVKGKAPLKLEKTTVQYGSTLTLTMDDNKGALLLPDGSLMYGEVTFSISSRYSHVAEIVSGNILKPKTAGTVIVKMSVDDSSYFDATEVTVEITITKRIIQLDWKEGTFIYNAKEQHPDVEITNLVGSDEVGLTVSGGKKVGDHTAVVTALTGVDSSNYTLERATNVEKGFHINPYVLSLTWGDLTLPYNGENQTPEAIIDIFEGDEAEVNLVVDGEHKNVGTYNVKATGVDNTNYVLDKEYDTSYSIVAADIDPKFSPASVVYGTTEVLTLTGNIDGAPYTLEVNKNDSVGLGTLAINKDGKYEFTATRVGVVKIKVHIDASASGNCNSYDGTVEITVVKAEREIKLLTVEGVYGEELVLEISGNDDDPGLVVYSVPDNIIASIVGNKLIPIHAGTVSLTIQVAATSSYNATSIVALLTIKPKVVEIEWQNYEFEYNGKEQAPEAKVKNLEPNDVCEVTVGGGAINAGNYSNAHVIGLSNPDYTYEGSLSASGYLFTISKKSIKIEIETDRVNVGKETELKVSGNEGKANMTFSVDNTDNATINGNKINPINKGSVYVTVVVDESQNYFGDTATKLIIIDRSQLELTLKTNTIRYGDDEGLVLEVDGNPENKQVQYSVTDKDGSAHLIAGNTILMPDRAGKVIVTATIVASETDNFATTTEEFEVTITPIEVELIWHNFEFTYDGKNLFAPTATIRSGLVGSDVCNVSVKGAQLNVGTYKEGTAYADDDSLSNKNYTLGGKKVNAPQFVINRAKPVISFITTSITIGVPTKIELSGNMEFGQTQFSLGDVTDSDHLTNLGAATLDDVTKGIITGTELGYIHVSVIVMPSDNYEGGQAECDILVEKPEAPIDLETKTVTYGDTLAVVVVHDITEAGFSYVLSFETIAGNTGNAIFDDVNSFLTGTYVGEVNIVITTTETASYKATEKKVKVTITPVIAEISWDIGEFEYDGTEKKPTATLSNLVGSDTVSTTVSGAIYASDEATAAVTALDNPNYTLEGSGSASTTFVIKPRKVDVVWTVTDLTYNGEKQSPEAEVGNVVSGDTVHLTVDGVKDAGENCTATAIAVSNSNYTVEGGTNLTVTFTIKPYAVNIKWGELHLIYTGAVNVPTATAVGTFNSEVVNVTVVGIDSAIGECIHASTSPYQAEATGLDNTNYTLIVPEATFAGRKLMTRSASTTADPLVTDYYIDQKVLTFSASSVTAKTYNGTVQEPDLIPEVLPVDIGNLLLSYSYDGGVTPVNVGEYKAFISLGGSACYDYKLSDTDNSGIVFKITPKQVDVIVTPKSVVAEYTGEAVKLTDWYTLSIDGLVGSDIGKNVEDVFTNNTLLIPPLFELADGSTTNSVGARGTYKLLADVTNATGTLTGNPNYEAELKLDTDANATLTIEGGESFKLALDSEYKFLYSEKQEMFGFQFIYRSSYDSNNWVHGKDDTDFDRVVLGNILPGTSAGELLDNFDPDQLDSIRVYNGDGDLVYDCGNDIGIPDSDLYDPFTYQVGTGWKVTYGKDASAADVVYISVLGDVDGDGACGGSDMAIIINYVSGSDPNALGDLEFMMAALVTNSGYVSASDISELGAIANGYSNIADYLV